MTATSDAWTTFRRVRVDGPALASWCARQWQRHAVALLGATLGAALLVLAFSDVWEAHDQAHQSLAAAQAKWTAQGPEAPMPQVLDPRAHAAGALWPRLPGRWPPEASAALRQFLIGQRLQVQSLRAMPDVVAGPLQAQSLAIRMTGRYADWVRAWQLMSTSGPLLSIERMSVSSLAQSSGVQLDVVLHLWSRPGSTQEVLWPPEGSTAPLSAAVDPFVWSGPTPEPPAAVPSRTAKSVVQTDDPMTWPLERVRWLGTWQQGADKQAVLSAGGPWIAVRVGQRVGPEGHKVAVIGADGLVLLSPQGQRLELKGSGR